MKKKTHKDFEKYVHSVIEEYVPILLLQRHTWKVVCKQDHKGSIMECVFHYPYLDVTLHYSEQAFSDWCGGRDLKQVIVHEMCHPITDGLYAKAVSVFKTKDEVEDVREELTDHICQIVLRVKEKTA
jgi:hypothetical protein